MIGGSLLEDFLRYFGDHGWLVYRIEDAGLNLVRQNGIDNDLGISGNFLASKIQLLNNWTSLVRARACSISKTNSCIVVDAEPAHELMRAVPSHGTRTAD